MWNLLLPSVLYKGIFHIILLFKIDLFVGVSWGNCFNQLFPFCLGEITDVSEFSTDSIGDLHHSVSNPKALPSRRSLLDLLQPEKSKPASTSSAPSSSNTSVEGELNTEQPPSKKPKIEENEVIIDAIVKEICSCLIFCMCYLNFTKWTCKSVGITFEQLNMIEKVYHESSLATCDSNIKRERKITTCV